MLNLARIAVIVLASLIGGFAYFIFFKSYAYWFAFHPVFPK